MATSNTVDATAFQYVQPEANRVIEPSTVIIDDATQFGHFEEKTSYLLDKFEYPRNGKEPGLIIIFNQVHFNNEKARTGSYRDVNDIILCFSRLGFNIQSKHIFTDLTKADMYSAIHKVLEDDLKEYNCLIVFFLTHGTNKNKLMTRDKTFSATAVWKQFAENKDLLNKPKMFIFQACKGSNYPKPSDVIKKVFLVPNTTFTVDCILPDMVVVFSSVEGSVSFRNNVCGSWFIQELCRNFSTYGRRDDVITLLHRTNKCVSRNYVSEYGSQQMPVFISTLNRMFYLNRNKDRSAMQEFNQNNDEILRSLNDLNMRVEEMKLLTKRKDTEEYPSENNT